MVHLHRKCAAIPKAQINMLIYFKLLESFMSMHEKLFA